MVDGFKKRCTTFEQCLPISEFMILAAKLHNEMIYEIERLQKENKILRDAMGTVNKSYENGRKDMKSDIICILGNL